MNRSRLALPLLVALAILPVVGACGAPQTKAQIELSKLPEYLGRDVELYDDTIEAAALGLTMEKPTFRGDAKFRERAQKARTVARVKVTTVTIDKVDDRSTYHLTLSVVGQPFAGGADGPLEVTLREGDRSFGVVNQLREGLRDKTLLGMWKLFRQGGEATPHFYLAPDDEGTMAAAKEAIVLQEVSKK